MSNFFVILPDDSTNTGPKVRTNDRIVSATTVNEHYFLAQDPVNDIQARVVSASPSANAAGYVVWPAVQTMNISGGVSVSPISGVVSVSGTVSGNVAISGAVSGVFSVSGAVAVSNAVSGIFSISGNVSVTNALSGVVSVSGPVSAVVTGTVTALVTGNVSVSGTVNVQGSQADAVTATANPVQVALFARQTNRTAVADSQTVRAMSDDLGRQVLLLNQVRDLVTQNRTSVAVTTETQILTAGATGVFHDLTYLKISNESQVMTRADVRAATGGTIRWTSVLVPGGTTNDAFIVPFQQASTATDWTVQLSVTATVHVTIQAVKNV